MNDSPEEEAALLESIAKFEMLTGRFSPEPTELLGLATVRLKLAQVTGASIGEVLPDVERALELDAEYLDPIGLMGASAARLGHYDQALSLHRRQEKGKE